MSLSIDDNTVASIHYTLTNNEGETLDSSEGNDPLIYLHGAGNLIPGLEKELKGKSAGHSMQVKVAPEEGYGPVHDGLIDIVPKAAFQGVDTIEPGMAFEAQGEDGQSRRITVTAINGDDVTVDANHPLAGVELHFDVEIVEVRNATEEEIARGHAH
ncbi:peptidylprolyl isomerase [Halioglobus sp.]|nr:peptidylprolyl isomerase [Halioglobus sp.]